MLRFTTLCSSSFLSSPRLAADAGWLRAFLTGQKASDGRTQHTLRKCYYVTLPPTPSSGRGASRSSEEQPCGANAFSCRTQVRLRCRTSPSHTRTSRTPAGWHFVVPTTLPCHPRVSRQNPALSSLLVSAIKSSFLCRVFHLAMISSISCPRAVKIAFRARYQQKRGRKVICGHKFVIFMAGPMLCISGSY